MRRASDEASAGFETACNSGDTEIGQLRVAVLGEQDVRRLHITMQDAGPVRGLQRPRNLDAKAQGAAPVQRTTLANQRIQRAVR